MTASTLMALSQQFAAKSNACVTVRDMLTDERQRETLSLLAKAWLDAAQMAFDTAASIGVTDDEAALRALADAGYVSNGDYVRHVERRAAQ